LNDGSKLEEISEESKQHSSSNEYSYTFSSGESSERDPRLLDPNRKIEVRKIEKPKGKKKKKKKKKSKKKKA